MVGTVVEELAPDSNFPMIVNGTNGTTTTGVNTAARDHYRLEIAMALTILMGIIQVCVSVGVLGHLRSYVSQLLRLF